MTTALMRVMTTMIGLGAFVALLLSARGQSSSAILVPAITLVVVTVLLFELFFRGYRLWQFRALLWSVLISGLGSISVVEWSRGQVLLSLYIAIAIAFVFDLAYFSLQDVQLQMYIKGKRRMHAALWVFVMFLFSINTFAFGMFFPNAPSWVPHTLLGFVSSAIAFAIWQLYLGITLKKGGMWSIIIGLIMYELIWALHWLPYGFYVLGFALTWLWYIAQLLIRFHLGPRGIIWKKQLKFLILNAILIIVLFLFFARWI